MLNGFTKYIHLFETENRTVLYNALTTKCFFLTDIQKEKINEGVLPANIFSEDEYSLLSSKGFFEDENAVVVDTVIKNNNQLEPDVFAMYLILTESCNMNCKYCSQSSSFRKREKLGNMSLETIESKINMFYKTPTDRKRTIVLYGGEPTMNKNGLRFAIECVRTKMQDWDTEIIIFTNGLLLDDALIDFLAENKISVILSLDGPKDINDMFRLKGENGTFDCVEKTISAFNEKGIKFGISATIASHNIEQLEDVVRFFVTQYHPFSIGLNPLHYPPEDRKYLGVDSKRMAEKMTDAYEVAAKDGIYIEQIMRRVRPFVLAQPRLKDCPSCGGMIRVLPDGSFGPCGHFMEEKKEQENGDYDIHTSETMIKWNQRVSCNIKGCDTCEALALCGGGCPYNSHINGGDIFSPNDQRSCLQAKEFLKYFLHKLSLMVPANTFYEITQAEKQSLLVDIDLDRYIPLERYSRYGEFTLDKRYL